MFEKELAKNRKKSSPSVLVPYRNRSGVVDLVGREPLMFAKVENGVTNSCHFFRRKNRKNANFGLIFRFFEQDRLLCVRVDIGVTKSPTNTANKKKKTIWV